MSLIQHGIRVGLLMVAAAVLFVWVDYHSEVTFADGLRYIGQAQRIEQGAWSDGLLKSVDHPLHPMAIAAAHRLLGGEGPASWQQAAQVVSIIGCVLLVIPLYLVGLEVYGTTTAWVGCLLFLGKPLMGYVSVNVLSETTFLLFWTWGLWAGIRFLREGRFVWLPVTIGFGALAYLARPEGMLLPLALIVTLLLLPLHWTTRIYWPRWWAAVAFLVLGPILLVAPYMAMKGGVATKPSVARLLGLAPKADADALERDKPLPEGQSTFETYRQASQRSLKILRASVSTFLLPLVVVGLVTVRPWSSRARIWLFTGLILTASAAGLIRLYATTGYSTLRYGLVPGMLLTLAAANGLAWMMQSIVIPGRWLGRGEERFHLGPAIWAVILACLIAIPHVQAMTPFANSFSAYRNAGEWIAQTKSHDHGKVLDLTDWSLYFSQQPGFKFNEVYWGVIDPNTRWVVVRDAHLNGHGRYSDVIRKFVAGYEPVALFPPHPTSRQVQIQIYDRRAPKTVSVVGKTRDSGKGRKDEKVTR